MNVRLRDHSRSTEVLDEREQATPCDCGILALAPATTLVADEGQVSLPPSL